MFTSGGCEVVVVGFIVLQGCVTVMKKKFKKVYSNFSS